MSFENLPIPLASGDILLYSDDHPAHQTILRRTGCRWGQVALVIKRDEADDLYVFEATSVSPCADARVGAQIQGVQISALSSRMHAYKGDIAVRKLDPSLSINQITTLNNYVNEVHGRPFNFDKRASVRALLRQNPPSDGRRYFCSELVPEAYQRLGLLPAPPAGRTANNYIPPDFSTCYSNAILAIHINYRLEKEVMLKGQWESSAED